MSEGRPMRSIYLKCHHNGNNGLKHEQVCVLFGKIAIGRSKLKLVI